MLLLAELRVLGDGFSYKRVALKGAHAPQLFQQAHSFLSRWTAHSAVATANELSAIL